VQSAIQEKYLQLQGEISMSLKKHWTVIAAAVVVSSLASIAFAEDHPYTEGTVVSVSQIRTVDGKFDEYMSWLDTKWKTYGEAQKKLGQILSYQVAVVEARGPNDPDVLLFVTYKNWAALDGAIEKGDALLKEVHETMASSDQAQASRASIRRILGSYTMQNLNLK
jgi:hypothetical protein